MTPIKLHGIFPPITTPFNAEGEIYKAKLEHNVAKWNKTTLTGYVVAGSNGESVMLSYEEKLRMFELVAQHAAPGKTLIAGTGAESVRETVALTNAAAERGYAAALVCTPHYYKSAMSNAATQAAYYRAVADAARIPVVLYNVPQNTGVELPAETVATLSEHPNIIGIKESSGRIDKIMQMVRETRAGFQVVVGSAPIMGPAFAVGAVGAIVAFANAAPYATIALWEAHRQRELDAVADWQARIAKPAVLVTAKHGIAGLKYAMDLNGYYGGNCRAPLAPIGVEARREIEAAFADLKG